jgi:hypothetical protein
VFVPQFYFGGVCGKSQILRSSVSLTDYGW